MENKTIISQTVMTKNTASLEQVLQLLCYSDAKEPHYKTNLIHAIAQFAGLTNNTNLEAECYSEIERIRAENENNKD